MSGAEAQNYKIEYVDGMLTVEESAGINSVTNGGKLFDVYTPDFGDTSPKQSFVFQFSSHSRTPLREHSQIHDFSASPKSTLPKHKNALFIGVSEDWYSAKC